MSYGVNVAASHRRAAAYVDKILRGASPATLPVEQAVKLEFVVNLKAARALGLVFPDIETITSISEAPASSRRRLTDTAVCIAAPPRSG